MKKFIENLISRLEHLLNNFGEHCEEWGSDQEGECKEKSCSDCVLRHAIEIVNQLAEEYINCSTDTSTNTSSGWIPCSERLPELTEGTECFKQSPCCLTTLKWWDGDMTESVGWYNQSGVWNEDSKNCKVIAWMPLPPAYVPKEGRE